MTSSAIPPSLTRSATACSTTLTGSCYKVHHAERRASSRADRPASLRSDHDRPIDVFTMERSGCSRSPKYAQESVRHACRAFDHEEIVEPQTTLSAEREPQNVLLAEPLVPCLAFRRRQQRPLCAVQKLPNRDTRRRSLLRADQSQPTSGFLELGNQHARIEQEPGKPPEGGVKLDQVGHATR